MPIRNAYRSLNSQTIKTLRKTGRYKDRGEGNARGLYLQVTVAHTGELDKKGEPAIASIARSWVYVDQAPGQKRKRYIGLGSYSDVTQEQAREEARRLRAIRIAGRDPFFERARVKEAARHTVLDCCQTYYDATIKPAPLNERVKLEWLNPLKQHLLQPHDPKAATKIKPENRVPNELRIGSMAIGAVTAKVAHAMFEPMWESNYKLANDMRSRLALVWEMAKARTWAAGENPFSKTRLAAEGLRMRLHSKANGGRKRKKRQPSLPYSQAPEFATRLLAKEDHAIRDAVLFGCLTALRTRPIVNLHWDWIDLAARVATIPADFLKDRESDDVVLEDYLLPLTPRVIALLESIPGPHTGHVFKHRGGRGIVAGSQIGPNALLPYVQSFGYTDPKQLDADGKPRQITMHGWRSTFRDWSGDQRLPTGGLRWDDALLNFCIQHDLAKESNAAYRRGDGFEARRGVLEAWADYFFSQVEAMPVAA